MTNFNRRNFISLSSLTFIGFKLLPISLHLFSAKKNIISISALLREAAVYRKNKEYTNALNTYYEVINLKSDEVRAYDGIRKIYLQSKFKELDVLQLYLDAAINNPGNIIFKERIAKEYMRLALGNKRMTQTISGDLLEMSKNIFDEIVFLDSRNSQFIAQQEKVYRKELQEAHVTDARDNKDLKSYRKNNKTVYKNRFKRTDIRDLENKLVDMLRASPSADRDKHIREIYVTLLNRYHMNRDKVSLTNKIIEFYNYNNDESSLYLIRRLCKKNNLAVIENIERINNERKNTFWSHITLAQVLINENKPNDATIILEKSEELSTTYLNKFEVKSKLIKLEILKNNFTEAKKLILNMGNFILGISSAHYINRYTILCAKYFMAKNDYTSASEVIDIAINHNDKKANDDILKLVIKINNHKVIENPIHLEDLYKFKSSIIN